MDERERIMREIAAADAIRASSQERIDGVVDAIRGDIYDKLIHHAWFGQSPQHYADDLYRYADKLQDAAMPEVEAPQQEPSMEAFYGAPKQEARELPQHATDLRHHGDKAQDAPISEAKAPTQEASMKGFYGAPEREEREPEPPAYEREMER